MSETNIVPIRPLSDDAAQAWIVGLGEMETTIAALARDWDWSPSKVRQRLAGWASKGIITRKPGLRRGRTIIAAVRKPVAAPPAVTLPEAASVTATDHPVSIVATPAVVGPAVHARSSGIVDLLAYAVAISLAGTAAYFSIRGMIVLFPGAPMAIVIMGLTMEAAKLVTVAFLAHQWRLIGHLSRAVPARLMATA